jgi:coenzyme F420-reducing hydrogenase delta subunit
MQKTVKEIGIDPDRVRMFNRSSAMGPRLAQIAAEVTDRTRQTGPAAVKTPAAG